MYKVGMNGFGRRKGQQGSLEIFKFTFMDSNMTSQSRFKEAFTIGAVLMQQNYQRDRQEEGVPWATALSHSHPVRVGGSVKVINTSRFQKAKQALSFTN